MEELQLPVCGGADKTHKKAAFWNATFLKLGKKVATAKVRKMQYSWKDNSLQPFDIIQKTILSSASFWEMSSSIFTFFGAKACLPACLSVCVRWNLECTTFSKSDLLRTASWLDWIPTQISVPKDTTVSQMERGQWLECPAILAASQVWEWNEKKKGASSSDIPWISQCKTKSLLPCSVRLYNGTEVLC